MKNCLERPSGDDIVDPESMATYLKAAYDESDDGELEITIPQSIQEAIQQGGDVDDEAGMVLRIMYELTNPSAGLFFVLPEESSYPNRPPHMYSHSISGPRCWMPCLDTTFDRCRWVLEFEVSADLTVVASGVAPSQPQDILSKDNSHAHASTFANSGSSTLLTASGHLNPIPFGSGINSSHNELHNSGSFLSLNSSASNIMNHSSKDVSLKRYTFVVTEPVRASSIGFAVGKFESVSDATVPNKLTFYNLLGRSSLLENTVGFMGHSLEYFEALLHSPLPAKHLKVVFVDDAPTKVDATAGLMICSTHLLYSPDVIDQAYSTRRAMSYGLAEQWFPTLVAAESVKDSWIVTGIVGYLAYLNYQKMFGQSEYRSAVLADLNYVLQGTRLSMKRKKPADFREQLEDIEPVDDPAIFLTDTLFSRSMKEYGTHSRYPNDPEPLDFSVIEKLGDAPFLRDALISDFDSPLYFSNFITPFDINTKYYYKRSTLVMLQLEKMVGTEIMRQLLELLVRPDENLGKPAQQQLTASKFFKICKKSVSHKNFVKFPIDWVYQQGIPHLHVGFQYHADSRKTEFVVKQDTALSNVVINPLTIRVHGARPNNTSLTSSSSSALSLLSASTLPSSQGPPGDDYQESQVEDHQILLDAAFQTFFTKSKSTSNQPEKQAAAKKKRRPKKKNDDDDTEDEDDDDNHGDSAELRMARARSDLGWIRVDPDMEWIRELTFRQPEYMWIAQLENDRDVLAQFEGVDGLVRAASSDLACYALTRVLGNTQNFFKVRMRAASALSALATRFPIANQLLQQYYFNNYYDQPEQAISNANSTMSTALSTATTSAVTTPGLPNGHNSTDTPSTPASTPASMSTMTFHNELDEPELRPNDFSDFESYFVQKAVTNAIASVRDVKNYSPDDTFPFLIGLLDSNDNSRNAYSDNYYVASLIHMLSYIRSDNPSDYVEMSKQIERYLSKEQMMPCFHNVIAQSCLHLRATLQAHGALDVELGSFKDYFSYGNLPSLRAVAIRCFLRLAICVVQTESSFDEAFYQVDKLLRNDHSVWFKHKVAFALAACFDSGVNLDPLFECTKANKWRTNVYKLVNSEVTAFTPRIRLLLLDVLKAIGGERIATAPRLPPRKMFPTHPPKTVHMAQLANDGSQQPRKKGAKRGHDAISVLPTQASSSMDLTPTSDRPQRRAAARARLTEPDPLETALGGALFVAKASSAVVSNGVTSSEEAKPRARFVFAKRPKITATEPSASPVAPGITIPSPAALAAATTSSNAMDITPTPTKLHIAPKVTIGTSSPSHPAPVAHTAPPASTPTVAPLPSSPATSVAPAQPQTTNAGSPPSAAAVAKRPVFKVTVKKTTPTEPSSVPAPAIPVQTPSAVPVAETPVQPISSPSAPAPVAVAPAPQPATPKARFVIKRATPAPEAPLEEPTTKRPKLDGE